MLGKIISMLDMLVHMQHYALRDLLHSRKLIKRKKKNKQGHSVALKGFPQRLVAPRD